MMSAHICSYKISCRLIQSEYAWTSASRCAGLSQIFKKALLDQFTDESCYSRDAGIQFFTEFCDAEISVVYAKTENLLLHNSSLALDVV